MQPLCKSLLWRHYLILTHETTSEISIPHLNVHLKHVLSIIHTRRAENKTRYIIHALMCKETRWWLHRGRPTAPLCPHSLILHILAAYCMFLIAGKLVIKDNDSRLKALLDLKFSPRDRFMRHFGK